MASRTMGSVVEPPPLIPPPYNLVRSSRTPRDAAGVRWTSGIRYRPALDFEAVGFSQCGTSSVMPTGVNRPAATVTWMPIVQVAAITCSTLGWRATNWRDDLTTLMAVSLPKFVETEFWTGAIAQREGLDNLWLAHPTHATDITTTYGGGTPSLKRAFAELEAALGDAGVGAQGMIHARRDAVPNFTGVRNEGNLLLTQNDTIVVPGVGYKGTGPNGIAPTANTTWMYATGLTDIRIESDITFIPDTEEPTINRDTNDLILRAEREVLVSWAGFRHFAIHATLDA